MTSFNKSAQLSLGPVAVGVFVNHNVHLCMRGCLTVKFLGSWKTVKGSLTVSWDSGAGLALAEAALLSMASLSMASVGGTGERTSVMACLQVTEGLSTESWLAVPRGLSQMKPFAGVRCSDEGDGGDKSVGREKQWEKRSGKVVIFHSA